MGASRIQAGQRRAKNSLTSTVNLLNIMPHESFALLFLFSIRPRQLTLGEDRNCARRTANTDHATFH